MRLSTIAAGGALAALVALVPAAAATASPSQPSTEASCQGQVNGYYNRSFSGGGQQTADLIHEVGGKTYSGYITTGAQSHDCNVPDGVPSGPPK